MPNIIHRIGFQDVSIEEIYKSISTVEGLASWWTVRVEGKSEIGGVLHFIFNVDGPEFEVVDMVKNQRVEWKCISGAPEWIDSHIEFELSKLDDEIILLFKHSGWRKEIEFMGHCSAQWAYFLFGLKRGLENPGHSTPFGGPNFRSISSWTK